MTEIYKLWPCKLKYIDDYLKMKYIHDHYLNLNIFNIISPLIENCNFTDKIADVGLPSVCCEYPWLVKELSWICTGREGTTKRWERERGVRESPCVPARNRLPNIGQWATAMW